MYIFIDININIFIFIFMLILRGYSLIGKTTILRIVIPGSKPGISIMRIGVISKHN